MTPHAYERKFQGVDVNQQETAGVQILATKTYYTTSTYYTTLIDKSETVTKTRTKIKSAIVTETYAGGLEGGYEPGPSIKSSAYQPSSEDERIVSLGANIYGKVRTLFATYTYFTTDLAGTIAKSMEVITQVRSITVEFAVYFCQKRNSKEIATI